MAEAGPPSAVASILASIPASLLSQRVGSAPALLTYYTLPKDCQDSRDTTAKAIAYRDLDRTAARP